MIQAMTDNEMVWLFIIGGLVLALAFLYATLLVWPLALVLVIAGYLIGGSTGATVGLAVAGAFGLLLILIAALQS